MNNLVNLNQINQIEIMWVNESNYQGTRVINCPPELRVIRDFFSRWAWSNLLYIAEGAADREAIGFDESGFRFAHNELDWNEEPFEGVEIYDPLGELYVTEEVFFKLMNMFFQAVIEGAKTGKTQLTEQPWWEQFIEIAKKIEPR